MKDVQPELYYVCSDFFDDVGDCVSLQRGDIVEIHEKHSSGWWYGRRLKDDFVLTWIPSAFLQKVKNEIIVFRLFILKIIIIIGTCF